MDTREAGKKGGLSRSAAKRAASARNLELARKLRAAMVELEAEAAPNDSNTKQWLEDARISIKNLETPGYVQKPVVLVSHQKASA